MRCYYTKRGGVKRSIAITLKKELCCGNNCSFGVNHIGEKGGEMEKKKGVARRRALEKCVALLTHICN